jgi:hypothetical protein
LPTPPVSPNRSDDGGLGFGPGGPDGTGAGASQGNGGKSGNGTPPGHVRDAAPNSTEGSLRVVDPTTPPSLFESVVGDVTGFFFGS